MSAKKRILNILFWSVVSAAFIGPGTITTAAKSGAVFGTELLWALVFSTLACLLLQEAAARLTMVSGKNLGQAIVVQFEKSKSKWLVLSLVLGAIVLGAAAYEMGNLLGAVAGFQLIFQHSFVYPCTHHRSSCGNNFEYSFDENNFYNYGVFSGCHGVGIFDYGDF